MSTSTRSNKRSRSEDGGRPLPKRRRTETKQISFTDDEGDTIVFRLSERKGEMCLSEHVNGKQTLARATRLSIDERTGKVVDDDGEADCFRLNEKERLGELKLLAEEAGIEVDFVADRSEEPIEEPVKPADVGVVVSPRKTPQEIWEEPEKPAPTPEKVAEKIEEPVKEKPAPTPTRGRSRSKSKTPRKSRSRTPRKSRKSPRKPKTWDPITFEDEDGLKVTFDMTADGHLRESVDGKVTLAKMTRLSINTAIYRIVDDDGVNESFTVGEGDVEKLGKLRDMACRAMDLDLDWSTEKPAPEAWCSIQ